MSRYIWMVALLLCVTSTALGQELQHLKISWEKNYLTVHGDFPGGELRTHYLEAYCRAGSTNQDWRTQSAPLNHC